jgi:hypothetical protein
MLDKFSLTKRSSTKKKINKNQENLEISDKNILNPLLRLGK